jgi:hypothetical protein
MSDRETYERNGWADGRLGQAYDLIYAAITDHPSCADALRKLREAVEDMDIALGDEETI